MDSAVHHFKELFKQLGLPADNQGIERFIQEHSPLAGSIDLPDAPFWSAAQASFLREEILDDADWSELIDQLNAALRQPEERDSVQRWLSSSASIKPTLNPPSDHATYVALLDGEEGVHPLPHALYVSLVRGEGEAPDFAGLTMTLADWYVRLVDGVPDVVVNETYTPITFDARGKVDWTSTTPGIRFQAVLGEDRELSWWPTETQRDKMRSAVFSGELSYGLPPTSGSTES